MVYKMLKSKARKPLQEGSSIPSQPCSLFGGRGDSVLVQVVNLLTKALTHVVDFPFKCDQPRHVDGVVSIHGSAILCSCHWFFLL